MQKFHNILFVSQALADEGDALKQALLIARHGNAELTALLVCPELPAEMADFRKSYEFALTEQLRATIQAARTAIDVAESELPVQVEMATGSMAAVRIVRHVLRNAHDLVIKQAEPKEGGVGLRAMDAELLRKCPCPVWLSRPIARSWREMSVGVAVDPQSSTPEAHDLSLRLLKLSRSLADTCNGELDIIACWDFELEEYLRRNVFIRMSDEELTKRVNDARDQHRADLDSLVGKSGIGGRLKVHHVRGRPDAIIPKHVVDANIDILVMGTVARTGIPGFTIGNTAENIVQKLGCSLLALKPNGFVSPVKAY